MMKMLQISWIALLFFFAETINGQFVLIPDPSTMVPDDCIALSELSTRSFIRDPSCGGTIRITDATGSNTLATFPSSVTEFTYQFEEPGEYLILCNSSVMPAEVDDIALCFSVSPMVPTMGEWAVINLGLALFILLVIGYRAYGVKEITTI